MFVLKAKQSCVTMSFIMTSPLYKAGHGHAIDFLNGNDGCTGWASCYKHGTRDYCLPCVSSYDWLYKPLVNFSHFFSWQFSHFFM